jgi:uncharacterized ion transporter superfamily protein YfcC
VLFSENAPVIIVLIFLIIFIGGGYAILNRVGVFEEIISKIVRRYGAKRYLLVCAVSLAFMFSETVFPMCSIRPTLCF